jgi:hypothetical protein
MKGFPWGRYQIQMVAQLTVAHDTLFPRSHNLDSAPCDTQMIPSAAQHVKRYFPSYYYISAYTVAFPLYFSPHLCYNVASLWLAHRKELER